MFERRLPLVSRRRGSVAGRGGGAGDATLPASQVLLHDQTEPANVDRTRQHRGWTLVPGSEHVTSPDPQSDRKAPLL